MNIIYKVLLSCVTLGLSLGCDAEQSTDNNKDATKIIDTEQKTESKSIELVLVLDKSGSMHGLEADTIGGFNSMIDQQKNNNLKGKVTTVLFNNEYNVLYSQSNLETVTPMTDKDYITGGTTALLDAVGNTLIKVENYDTVKNKESQVVFVVITDGLENASTEFSTQKIKNIISEKQEKDGWKFVFLGANIDAVSAADSIGIDKNNAIKYKNSSSGVRKNFDAVAEFSREAAEESVGSSPSSNWKELVEEDK